MRRLYRISMVKQNLFADNYMRFRRYASMLLAGMTGLMIAYPYALGYLGTPYKSYLILISSFIAGVLIGYRRRNSRIFLYFCMLAIIILASVISLSLGFDTQGNP